MKRAKSKVRTRSKKKKTKVSSPRTKSAVKAKITRTSSSESVRLNIAIPTKKIRRKKISRSIKTIESQIKKALPKEKKEEKQDSGKSRKSDMIDLSAKTKSARNIVIFDTNFLLIPEQFKIDIFNQAKMLLSGTVEFMIFDKTIYELQKLSSGSAKHVVSAKVALQLINDHKIDIITSHDDKYVDDLLVDIGQYLPDFDGTLIIATQDKELKDRLKSKVVRIMYMASKQKLGLK
ncbi:hypothetical protein H6503_02955 [Candidatus Woesearchaeota archaeon]|nr:hypothetical protein [Candidatus Woesearchaeota archaeon]